MGRYLVATLTEIGMKDTRFWKQGERDVDFRSRKMLYMYKRYVVPFHYPKFFSHDISGC